MGKSSKLLKATNYGIQRITEGFPVCNRLIRDIHRILLNGVSGEKKTPGEFRTSQNWIGRTVPSTAAYVPPLIEELSDCLKDLELFY